MMKQKGLLFLLTVLWIAACNAGGWALTAAADSQIVWDGTIAGSFAGGDGSEDAPYQIADGAQLAFLAQRTEAGDEAYRGKHYVLTADIALNDTEGWENWEDSAPQNHWVPIGRDDNFPFRGVFRGDGHTISGIYIKTEQSFQGLFGCLLGAAVENVTISDCYIEADSSVGGIAGTADSGAISGCFASGLVRANRYVGGVIGYASPGSRITDCSHSGRSDGFWYVGGIVGYTSSDLVDGCDNTGDIIGAEYVGGIAGMVDRGVTVIDCYSTGTVESTGAFGCGGGIAGYVSSSNVQYCDNTGNVIGGGDRVGGIAGSIWNSEITGCRNAGSVAGAAQYGYVGGIVGEFFSGTVANCLNTGNISGTELVGGIAGQSSGRVSNCYNTGNISGTELVGGIAGQSSGDADACYSAGNVTGARLTGGIAGDVDGGTVNGCYYLDAGITGGNPYGTALSEPQMRSQSSFEGWDFTDTWLISETGAYPYPQLRAVPHDAQQDILGLLGDADGDGDITTYDAVLILQICAGAIMPSETRLMLCDADGDAVIATYDAVLLLQYTAGIFPAYPIGEPVPA